jgi:hypothetical protein
MHFVSERRDHRLVAVGSALIALALVAVCAFAARAQAAETVYWDNYSLNTLGHANIDGSGGGLLPLGTAELKDPEGLALDVAGGRLFAASASSGSEKKGSIFYANIDGSGAGTLNVGSAPVDIPEGVAIDPATGTIYWANEGKGSTDLGSIAFAKLDGSGGGVLNTSGATVEKPYRVGIDTVNGRLYWANTNGPNETISYANLNGSGGGNLNITGTSPINPTGFTVDPAGGRLYWVTNETGKEVISYTGLLGGAGGDIPSTGVLKDPFGLAFDPTIGRLYWGNYNESKPEAGKDAIGFQGLSGGGGSISIPGVPIEGPQDPVILKSPVGAGVPSLTRSTTSRSSLSCSQGSWASYPSSFVYAEPRSYGYQWLLNGAPIAGATATTFGATKPGSYTCAVTAVNQAGSTVQTSGAVTLKAAKVKLTVKPRTAQAKAGKLATFSIKALNQGDVRTGNARVCVKLPKKAKKALKAPKCKKVGKVQGRKSKSTKLKLKLKPDAQGSYKVKIQVKGTGGKAVNATIKVIG